MLQVFHIDVAKVDQDVAYVAMVIHVCCKRLFQMFHLFFQTYVVSVFIGTLNMFHTNIECFIWMLHMFLMAFQVFSVFLQVFQEHVSSVSSVFRRMLQIFHLDVSKVD